MDDFLIRNKKYEYIGNDPTYIRGKIYILSIQLVTYGLLVFIIDNNWRIYMEIYDNEYRKFKYDWRMVI